MFVHNPMFGAGLFALSLACSALGGILGMASGIFIVPVLTEFCGIDLHTAITASLISVIACSCGSAPPFLKSKLANIRLAVVLEVATTSGALAGVLLFGFLSDKFLLFLLAIILLISIQQMLNKRGSDEKLREEYEAASANQLGCSLERLPLGMILMFGAGLLSALLGIGSGVLKIPAMDSALRLPLKVSSATSNFMIGVTAAASACAYLALGDVVAEIAAPVAAGSVLGAKLGTKILMFIPSDKLRVLFAIILLGLAVQLILSALGIHPFKGGE